MSNFRNTDFEKSKVFKAIFDYHGMSPSPELQGVWNEDLQSCDAAEIKDAWNEWRKNSVNKRPTSYELYKLVKSKNSEVHAKLDTVVKSEPLLRGRSYLEDRLIDDIKIMNKNNPDLLKDISKCESVYDKIGICVTALGKPELLNSPVLKALQRSVENREVV
jgi:hypothetical protein